VDVDNFKAINDRHGHLAGDDVLVRYARILEAACDGYGRAIRLGGDEFAVTMHTVPNLDWLHVVAARLVDALTLPIRVGDADLVCSASVGAAATVHSDRLHELLAAADRALLHAKQLGKSRYHLIEL
jgi:diguanylate cyclase (GGDEF)-like protein